VTRHRWSPRRTMSSTGLYRQHHDYLLCFTNTGRVYWLKVFRYRFTGGKESRREPPQPERRGGHHRHPGQRVPGRTVLLLPRDSVRSSRYRLLPVLFPVPWGFMPSGCGHNGWSMSS
jgi:hypothetical protein